MKILVASDLHYRLKQLDWLAAQSSHYDALIIAGDMLDISSYLDLSVQIEVIGKYLKHISAKTDLLVCSGNHDGNEKNAADEYIAPWLRQRKAGRLYVDGDSVFFGSTLFTIFPWWDGDVTKVEVQQQFHEASQLAYNRWVWIYHAPPDHSSTSWNGKRHIGDIELNKWIDEYQPDLVFSGHIHESPFKKDGSWVDKIDQTWVCNAGSLMGDIPAHIIFDLEAMQLQWHSLAGSEIQDLS